MDNLTTPRRGEIWTIPALGGDARVLLIASPRIDGEGRPVSAQAVPVRVEPVESAGWTTEDLMLTPTENSLGVELHAAYWNTRPVAVEQLGTKAGEVIDPAALEAIRDGHLRLFDPDMPIDAKRWGARKWTDELQAVHAEEIRRWMGLTALPAMKVMPTQVELSGALLNWFDTGQFLAVPDYLMQGDQMLPDPDVQMVGSSGVLLKQRLMAPHEQESWIYLSMLGKAARESVQMGMFVSEPTNVPYYRKFEGFDIDIVLTESTQVEPASLAGANTEMALAA